MTIKGTEETKEFYDSEGWHEADNGRTLDGALFGVKEDGPLRKRMFERKWARIATGLDQTTDNKLLEVGCGGSPEVRMLEYCSEYVGTDFSSKGLHVATEMLKSADAKVTLTEADAVALPFEDNSFDVVYSAHMIYHIKDRAAQVGALNEMLRVLRPGGRLILQTANPRPFFFPLRSFIRIVADTPYLSRFARSLKGPSPIPYNPAKLSWYRKMLMNCADVELLNGGIASTHFNQTVSEYTPVGKSIWKLFDWCDKTLPKASARFGNYVLILARKGH